MEDRKAALLPVPYFHLVCTVPHALNPLILTHKRPLLTLLFKAASQTLVQFGQRNLGGQIGCTMVLHTWDQTLGAHFHVHCVIAAGALATNGARWIEADSRFLFPVRALSTVFRGKFCEALAWLWTTGALPLPEESTTVGSPVGFAPLRAQLYAKEWVVYATPPCAGPSTSWTLSAALRIASLSHTTGSSTCGMGGSALPTGTVSRATVSRR